MRVIIFIFLSLVTSSVFAQKEEYQEMFKADMEKVSELVEPFGPAVWDCNQLGVMKKTIDDVQVFADQRGPAYDALQPENRYENDETIMDAMFLELFAEETQSVIHKMETLYYLSSDLCDHLSEKVALKDTADLGKVISMYNAYGELESFHSGFQEEMDKYTYYLNNEAIANYPTLKCENLAELDQVLSAMNDQLKNYEGYKNFLDSVYQTLPPRLQSIEVSNPHAPSSSTKVQLFNQFKGFRTNNPNDPYGKQLNTDDFDEKIGTAKKALECE